MSHSVPVYIVQLLNIGFWVCKHGFVNCIAAYKPKFRCRESKEKYRETQTQTATATYGGGTYLNICLMMVKAMNRIAAYLHSLLLPANLVWGWYNLQSHVCKRQYNFEKNQLNQKHILFEPIKRHFHIPIVKSLLNDSLISANERAHFVQFLRCLLIHYLKKSYFHLLN